MSLLFLSDGSQANKIVCRGTVDDLKLTLVTLATMVVVEAASKKNHFFHLRAHLTPFGLCHLTGDEFVLKTRFKPFFRHKTTSLV